MNDHDYQWDDIAEAVIWHRNNLIKLVYDFFLRFMHI